MDADQEKVTKERNRRPRQVKSRPPSSSANETARLNDVTRPVSTSAISRRARIGPDEELFIKLAEPMMIDLEEEPKSTRMLIHGSKDVSESADDVNHMAPERSQKP